MGDDEPWGKIFGEWTEWTDACRANNYNGAELAVFRWDPEGFLIPLGPIPTIIQWLTGTKPIPLSDQVGAINIRMWCTDGNYHQTEVPSGMPDR